MIILLYAFDYGISYLLNIECKMLPSHVVWNIFAQAICYFYIIKYFSYCQVRTPYYEAHWYHPLYFLETVYTQWDYTNLWVNGKYKHCKRSQAMVIWNTH